MGKVKLLPETLANQIAAGEVVQRPASIVKELVENSFDAGARQVDIALEAGGKRKIEVRDDGCGMSEEDAILAFERHATSKIATSEDLLDIRSFGFRGEALPSIAAVSRVELTTAEQDGEGYRVIIEGNRIVKSTPVSSPRGTTLLVRRLFFNTPARRKFLKSTQTEYQHCLDTVTRFAIIHHEKAISLTHNDRVIFNLHPVSDMRTRIGQLFGEAYTESVIPFQGKQRSITIQGLMGNLFLARSNRSQQYFFVNHRPVQNKTLMYAITNATKHILPKGKFPVVFIDVSIDPKEVDVNVHPAKTEVRFRDEYMVHQLSLKLLQEVLAQHVPKAHPRNMSFPVSAVAPGEVRQGMDEKTGAESEQDSDGEGAKGSTQGIHSSERTGEASPLSMPSMPIENLYQDAGERNNTIAFAVPQQGLHQGQGGKDEQQRGQEPREGERAPWADEQHSDTGGGWTEHEVFFKALRYVGQVMNSFLVFENESEMVIIDQHAAHERVLFEKIRAQLEQQQVVSQGLLFPETIEFSPTEFERAMKHKSYLELLGFEIEEFGSSTVIIRAVPAWLRSRDPRPIVLELLDEIQAFIESGKPMNFDLRDELAKLMACKAAIKIHRPLTFKEVSELLKNLSTTHTPFTCPHGRPVMVTFNFRDFQRFFKR